MDSSILTHIKNLNYYYLNNPNILFTNIDDHIIILQRLINTITDENRYGIVDYQNASYTGYNFIVLKIINIWHPNIIYDILSFYHCGLNCIIKLKVNQIIDIDSTNSYSNYFNTNTFNTNTFNTNTFNTNTFNTNTFNTNTNDVIMTNIVELTFFQNIDRVFNEICRKYLYSYNYDYNGVLI